MFLKRLVLHFNIFLAAYITRSYEDLQITQIFTSISLYGHILFPMADYNGWSCQNQLHVPRTKGER